MKLYDTSTPSVSIIHHTWDLVDADITSFPLNRAVREINAAYEELISLIINADGTWQFDDTNHTDLPRGTGDLVEGQEAYSFSSEYLQIEAVEILDTNSAYRRIKPLDHKELGGESPHEYFGVSSGSPTTGFPEYFDQVGDTIMLYPSPTATNVTLTAGIRIWFKRTADLFTISDTTQAPGLPSTHHVLLAYMAALPYAASYKRDRVAWLEKKVDDMKKSLLSHYGSRERTKRHQATMSPIAFR